MKITGSATLHAPREKVWAALNDPAVLVRTIPGCQQLEEVGPDSYRMTINAGVASIKGTYEGEVSLADHDEPSSFVLRAAGAGAPGTVSADVRVTLSEVADGADPSTRLDYDADAIVGGMIGGVGQRVLTGVAKKTAGEFFAAVDDVLTGKAPAVPAPREEPVAVGAPPAEGAPRPFRTRLREALAAPSEELVAQFAALSADVMARTARVMALGESAASTDSQLGELRERGHAAMRSDCRDVAAALAARGALAGDITADSAANALYAIVNESVYLRLVDGCGWTLDEYRTWLERTLRQMLLRQPCR